MTPPPKKGPDVNEQWYRASLHVFFVISKMGNNQNTKQQGMIKEIILYPYSGILCSYYK